MRPLTVRVGCEFKHSISATVPAIFLIRPKGSLDVQVIHETWTATPHAPYHDYVDLYGNICRRMNLPPGDSTITYDATVVVQGNYDPYDYDAVQARVEDLPDDVLLFTLPSRYALSDELSDKAWELFGSTAPGWARAQAISDFVHNHITFGYGWSTPTTTSSDVFAAGKGVCRDFTHLMIAFCRAMNLPARYVFGYMPDLDVLPPYFEMDFCAWLEVFLDDKWWTFDPRNNMRRRARIVIARGRDALDVAMVTTYGSATFLGMTVVADDIPQ